MVGSTLLNANRRDVQPFVFAVLLGCFICNGSDELYADEIISTQLENSTGFSQPAVPFSGVEPDAALADSQFLNSNQWNHLGEPFNNGGNPIGAVSFSNLVDSTGAISGASLSITNITGAFNAVAKATLPDTYFYSNNSTQSFTISGLTPNEGFTLFLYAYNTTTSPNNRGAVFSVGSASFDTKNGNPSSEDPVSAVTGLLTGQTSSTGSITGTWAFDSTNTGGEIDWSGFQLDVATTAAVPAPLIGRGLPVLLALAGLLFCAELLERNKRRSLSLLPPRV